MLQQVIQLFPIRVCQFLRAWTARAQATPPWQFAASQPDVDTPLPHAAPLAQKFGVPSQGAPRCGAFGTAQPSEAVTATGEIRRLGLEVQFDPEPIQGRLYDHEDRGRLDRPFTGWLGLMAAIEAARGADRRPAQGQMGEA